MGFLHLQIGPEVASGDLGALLWVALLPGEGMRLMWGPGCVGSYRGKTWSWSSPSC